jgi:D-cysteine desulfhydrase
MLRPVDLRLPDRRSLAHLPTPLQRGRRLGADLGLDLWIKRDDLTGSALTGNKVRKLEFLAADALRAGADTLITCGAVTSNHARATAVAAARCGLRSHLVLRGEEPDLPDGNLLLDRLLGAGLTFIAREAWPDRETIMGDVAARLAEAGRRGYPIPEGGSNALGALGYAVAAHELLGQAEAQGLDLRRVVHATGSGGTTAGLALGFAAAGREDVDVVGVAVCDDRAHFDDVVSRILDGAAAAGYATPDVRARARWRILEGYKGSGYAQTTPAEMDAIANVARTEGLILDPVYTGKAFAGLQGEASAGRFADGGATVFLHTGGIFGLFSFAEQVRATSPADPGSAPRPS